MAREVWFLVVFFRPDKWILPEPTELLGQNGNLRLFEKERKLGQGFYGTVWKVIRTNSAGSQLSEIATRTINPYRVEFAAEHDRMLSFFQTEHKTRVFACKVMPLNSRGNGSVPGSLDNELRMYTAQL